MTPEQVSGPSVECAGVTVRFGDVIALVDVSLRVAPGEFVAVIGPSGAGKSTLLWVLAGAAGPSGGSVLVDGAAPVPPGPGEHDVALIPQGNGLAAVLTAAENVVLPLLADGVRAGEAHARAEAALAAVGLQDSGDHLVEELSGGQQQRVAVARGIATRPRLLLADEPTSELDHVNRERMLDLLRDNASRGATVIMTTHDPEAAARADRVLHLDEGRLEAAPTGLR